MRNVAALFLCLIIAVPAFAEDGVAASTATATAPAPQVYNGYEYRRPGGLDFIKKVPGDIVDYGRETFRKENAGWITGIVVGTGILLVADQWLVDRAQNLGDHLGITHTQYQKKFVRIPIAGAELRIEGPFDSGSALYFLGDGWTDVVIVTSFLGYGLATDNNRSIQTASQITESILASGAVVQTLKHITGRESPFTTTHPRGNWRFFPNQRDYADNVPKYDAFPSGHLCAAMATVTVIADNYPEKRYVRPIGYTLMSVLGFQMLNNGVHWASDYPLGIALGYGFGKIAVRQGRQAHEGQSVFLMPTILDGGAGVQATVFFNGEHHKRT